MKDRSDIFSAVLTEASYARGLSNPNPAVGAVIVKSGRIIGLGHTLKAGSHHAEIIALKSVRSQASLKGAELYVSLTPCCFQGRTPPCTDAIIRAGISTVHIACRDNNPRTRRSEILLKQSGIKVLHDFPAETSTRLFDLNEDFFFKNAYGRPFLVLKYAMTCDGKLAGAGGDSRWISGKESRQLVHRLRLNYDAVMAGEGTVLKDDPRLNVRIPEAVRQPLRIIINGSKKLSASLNVFKDPGQVLLIHNRSIRYGRTFNRKNIHLMPAGQKNGSFDLASLISRAGTDFALNSIFVEGGAELHGSLLRTGLADKLHVFTAPRLLLDGSGGLSPNTGARGTALMKDSLQGRDVTYERIGDDMHTCMYLNQLKAKLKKRLVY